jgi:hypothetical protein
MGAPETHALTWRPEANTPIVSVRNASYLSIDLLSRGMSMPSFCEVRLLRLRLLLHVSCGLLVLLVVTGCNRSTTNSTPNTTPGTNTTANLEQSPKGDIPDTATYLTHHGPVYSLQYVEGWVQETLPNNGIKFFDKDSLVSVTLTNNPLGSMADYARGPGTTSSTTEFQRFGNSRVSTPSLPAGETALLTFQALSAPDPVTGKTVMQMYDRYFIRGPQYMAILSEGTPVGVDNIDAFLQIAKSFTWGNH